MMDSVPCFSTFGKNYTCRFKDTDLFGQISSHILGQCMDAGLVDTSHIFVDATHVKACANSKKRQEQAVHDEALWYEDELKKEIARDREYHGKEPLKDKNRDDPPSGGSTGGDGKRPVSAARLTQRVAGFGKGDTNMSSLIPCRLPVTGTDVTAYTVHPGNGHDSRTFKPLYEKIKGYTPGIIRMEAGYRTPAIAHELLTDGVLPLLPYKRPMTKDGFFKKYEYVYDEYLNRGVGWKPYFPN